jgi:pilus assembly protein CpaF
MIPRKVFEETLLQFFDPIRPLLDDPTVSDILINGHAQVFVERAGVLHKTQFAFPNQEALTAALRNCAQFVGKHADADSPILEARLPDGSRVEAILPPASPDGPHVAIRRFSKETLTMERLIQFGAATEEAGMALSAFVQSGLNMIIAGGTGSGKTTILNALSGYARDEDRIVVIEDSRELQLQKPHVVQLESRPPDARGEGEITIRDLFRASLRMRPDRIVVGEIRGGEALDLIQAMTSGHGGSLTTVHATYPRDTLTRLETMAMMSDLDMPLIPLRIQIASGVNMLVQVARQQDGSRVITHVTEVLGYDMATSAYLMQDLLVRQYQGIGENGDVLSTLHATGAEPRCLAQLRAHGTDLPATMLVAHK